MQGISFAGKPNGEMACKDEVKDERHMIVVAKNGSRNFLKTCSSFASIDRNEIVHHFDEWRRDIKE